MERIRLHQFVARTHQATVDYGGLLGDDIDLVVDRATRIDTANRTVELATGPALAYDYVIYAVGSTAAAERMYEPSAGRIMLARNGPDGSLLMAVASCSAVVPASTEIE